MLGRLSVEGFTPFDRFMASDLPVEVSRPLQALDLHYFLAPSVVAF
jgi:hypothetical protein